jgi:SET domain-containing protein
MIKAGDVVEIDNDQWAYVGKQYEVVTITMHINSTGVEMTLRDLSNPDRKISGTFTSHQIHKIDHNQNHSTQYDLFPTVEIKPSLIQNAGVGVFALVDIPADTKIFKSRRPMQKIKLSKLTNLNDRQRQHLNKLAHIEYDQTLAIDCDANEFYAAYFVNHSSNPNLIYCDMEYEWYTIKDIAAGEELTAYYFPYERDF